MFRKLVCGRNVGKKNVEVSKRGVISQLRTGGLCFGRLGGGLWMMRIG